MSRSDRRRFVKMTGAALCMTLLPVRYQRADAVLPVSPLSLSFDILHGDEPIGYHRLSMMREGNRMRIKTRVEATIKVAFYTAFEYRHESEELWDDRGLLTLNSTTQDQGERFNVRGVRLQDAFRVVGPAGPYLAPVATLTTDSVWTYAVVSQTTLIDVKRGGVVGVDVQPQGDETVEVVGEPRPARRYRIITPYFAGLLWYDADDQWVQGTLERDGEIVEFRRA